ncbi:MAG: hypothetical protein M0R31_02770 [Candidatus Riflebacteria bacterium]|nr:hypothetical protein [Candidatus Riflebacteria bacterium]
MSKIFSLSLYHTSFAPLWISILFIDIKSCIENPSSRWTEMISISCILISCLIALIVLMVALCTNGKEGTTPRKVISATEEKTITAEFLLSYILPLFAFDFTQWNQVVLFLIFYLTLGFLCVRHNYFSVNIILEVSNFRFYTCMTQNEDGQVLEQRIISHRRLNGCVGETLYLKSLNNEYKLDIQQ